MFTKIGAFAQKFKYFIIAGWVIITAVLVLTAPQISKVGVTDQSQFLPQNTDSARARNLLNTKFGNVEESSSSLIIVIYNETGLNQDDLDRTENIYNWLISDASPESVSGVISIFTNDALQSTLVSSDNTTTLMTVELSVPALDEQAQQAVTEIRNQFSLQPGTSFYLTGNVGLMNDLFNSVQDTISRTTWVTIILVIILLLIIYRSPIAFLVPLVTIGISYLTTRGIVGFLAGAGVEVSTIIDAYLVVTIFGVGTDYCLFIVSRFREQMHNGDGTNPISYTMKRIGPVILASAVTVIIAFLCLGISKFGMTRTSGWALAIGIIITLGAGITLVPALMAVFGRYLFWPSMLFKPRKQSKFGWSSIGRCVSKHPIITAIPIIVILVIPYITLPKMRLSANVLSQLPKNVESSKGLNIIRDHFPVNDLSPLYLTIQSPSGSLLTENSLDSLKIVAQSLENVDGISRADYFSAPAVQLSDIGNKIKNIHIMSSMGLPDPVQIALIPSIIQPVAADLSQLAIRYPGIIESPNFKQIFTTLQNLQTILVQLSTAQPDALITLLPQLQRTLDELSGSFSGLNDEFKLNADNPFVNWLKKTYFSTDGTVARINLILETDPYSDESATVVTEIRKEAPLAISNSTLNGSVCYVGGDAAIHSDMLDTANSDFKNVLIITAIGIFAVIVILLRSLLAPLYMVITVLFNFGATMGITTWLFIDIMKTESLIYLLPVFVFVMLAAVGADYNIFLVSRIREESETKPVKEAVHIAVKNTGGVITSCGIILAGTFATLATSSLPIVLQIGVPIALGVIVDTFIIRALLVPALASIAGRWSWWPSKLARQNKK